MKQNHICIFILLAIFLFHTNITLVLFQSQIKPFPTFRRENGPFRMNDNFEFEFEKEHPQLRTVAYNVSTKTEERYAEINSTSESHSITRISPFKGNLNENKDIETVFPPDDRTKVTDTTIYPWTSICKIYITADDDTNWVGSGVIIDEFHVLTAGHNVYLHDHGGWAKEVKVVPGKDDTYEPYGHAYSTYMQSYSGWIDSQMVEHDWAVVTLDRNIGYYTGWMGIITRDSSDPIYTGDLNTAGYPGDLSQGEEMYKTTGVGDYADEYNHYYWLDSMGGQSGSPVWWLDGNDPYILSVNAYSHNSTSWSNFGTRITTAKFNSIITWLGEDTPPEDKPDLADKGSEFSSINPSIVFAGQTNFQINSTIENNGLVASGSFNISYFLSTNSFITTTDILIGTELYASIAPSNYRILSYTGMIPSSISEGDFYVGWLIDSYNKIEEFDETNNEGLCSTTLLVIQSNSDPYTIILTIFISIIAFSSLGILSLFVIRRRNANNERKLLVLKSDNEFHQDEGSIFSFCPNCGSKIQDNPLYCRYCSFKLN